MIAAVVLGSTNLFGGRGTISAGQMGVTLMHEHILVDASGKWVPPACCSKRHIGEQEVHVGILGALRMNPLMNRDNCPLFDIDAASEELMKFRELGGQTIVDPTNLGIGRDPLALQRIARRTGLNYAANEIRDIRAAVCHDVHSAHQSVEHDDVNVMCLGAQIVGAWLATDLIDAFLPAEFSTDADFRRRVEKLNALAKSANGCGAICVRTPHPLARRLPLSSMSP